MNNEPSVMGRVALPDGHRKGRSNIVPTDPNERYLLLQHFHVCVHCGSAFRREEVEGRAHTTGIFLCPKRGIEGPLNLEIREIDQPEPEPPKDE
jgi:hypothetical protein